MNNEEGQLSIGNYQLSILEADRQPVGVFQKEAQFKEYEIQLTDGDIYYIFSDGYHSQFGGEKNEKFKTKRFKDLLSEIHQLPMDAQRQILDSKFIEWRGDLEQTDDVLVIGVRI